MPARVEPLSPHHQVKDFDSGTPSLDRWLSAYAGQAQRRGLARTFLAVRDDGHVIGYYTLVASQVTYADAPTPIRAGASRHFPIPVVLLARLAVARSHQGRGLGRDLLRDAISRTAAAADIVGIRAILVDAIDDHAAAFYRRHGFIDATGGELRLMIPVAAAEHPRRH